MDYINLPRRLIYKERDDLKDFGVQVIETVNQQLFLNLKDLFKATDRAKELILRCFNNAYYICTIIPFVDFPELQVDKFENIILKGDPYDRDEICAVSMAMVCKLLPACDARWKSEGNDLIKNIHYRFTHYQWMNCGARKSFEFMMERHNTDNLSLPQNEFAPRDIIELVDTLSERDLQVYAEYICERLTFLENPRQRMHWADMAIARIKGYQLELCKDSEYNPKKDCFEYSDSEGMPIIEDFDWEERIRNDYQQSKEALKYYMEHYPKEENIHNEQQTDSALTVSGNTTLVAENEQLRQQLIQRDNEVLELKKENDNFKELLQQKADNNSELERLKKENTELKEKIEDLLKPVEDLPAKQKVRMELAYRLLSAAGMTEEVLGQQNNKQKAATVMSVLLGIHNNNARGNEAQTCATYISARDLSQERHKKTIDKINSLLKDINIDIQL